MNALILVACFAVLFNATAVWSGWAVLLRHPELLKRNFGKGLSLDPIYLLYALVTSTTFLAMYLTMLLLWWFKSPGIRSADHLAAIIFMLYHLGTGVATTGVHITIGRVTRVLLGANPPAGVSRDVVVAKGAVRAA